MADEDPIIEQSKLLVLTGLSADFIQHVLAVGGPELLETVVSKIAEGFSHTIDIPAFRGYTPAGGYQYSTSENPLVEGGLSVALVDYIIAQEGTDGLKATLKVLSRGIARSLHSDVLSAYCSKHRIPYEGLPHELARRAVSLIDAKDLDRFTLEEHVKKLSRETRTNAVDEEMLALASDRIDELEAQVTALQRAAERHTTVKDQYARLLIQIAGHPNAKNLRGVLERLLAELQGTERPARPQPTPTQAPPTEAPRAAARPAPTAGPQNYFTLGKTAFAAQKYTDAVAALSNAARSDPKNGWIQYYLGMTYHAINRSSDARQAASSAVKLRPAFATKDLEEAVAFIVKKDYTRALWAVERASLFGKYSDKVQQKKIADSSNQVGVAFKDGTAGKKDYTAAKRAFSCALAVDTAYIPAHYHLGSIAFMEKDYATAERELTSVLRSDVNHKWAHYQLGRVYEQTNRKHSARKEYEAAVRLGLSEARSALAKI